MFTTDWIEIDFFSDFNLGFAIGNFVSQTSGVFTPQSVEIDQFNDFSMDKAIQSYVSQAPGVYTPRSFIIDLYNDFGFTLSPKAYTTPLVNVFSRSITPSFILYFDFLPYNLSDSTKIIVWGIENPVPPLVPVYPSSGYDIEILYPIVPVLVSNIELHKTDSGTYKQFTKPSANQLYSTLKFRINSNSIAAFLFFIKSNRTNIVNLYTPSIYPFGNAFLNSYVYIIGYSKPVLEKPQYWRMDVTFLQVTGIA